MMASYTDYSIDWVFLLQNNSLGSLVGYWYLLLLWSMGSYLKPELLLRHSV